MRPGREVALGGQVCRYMVVSEVKAVTFRLSGWIGGIQALVSYITGYKWRLSRYGVNYDVFVINIIPQIFIVKGRQVSHHPSFHSIYWVISVIAPVIEGNRSWNALLTVQFLRSRMCLSKMECNVPSPFRSDTASNPSNFQFTLTFWE